MEFLIFSDSHGKRRNMELALSRQVRKPNAIFFSGDGLRDIGDRMNGIPVFRVHGNCDWSLGIDADAPEELTVTFGNRRIFLTHGHRLGAKSGVGGLLCAAAERNADIVLYGHTHIPALETVPAGTETACGVLPRAVSLFNAGSIAEGSFGTLTLTDSAVLFAHGSL